MTPGRAMIRHALLGAALVTGMFGPAEASPVSTAVETAVAACEQWLLEPKTWVDGIAEFPRSAGLLGQGLRQVPSVPDAALPPPGLRTSLHFWHVAVNSGGGLYVTVSDRQPMCHVVGGGPEDFQPQVSTLLGGRAFLTRWKLVEDTKRDGIRSARYQNKQSQRLGMIVSHAATAGGGLDRPQLIITAQYEIGD